MKFFRMSKLNGAVEEKDFVMEGISLIYSGKRNWNYTEFPNIVEHLKNIIDSLISNYYKSSTYNNSVKIHSEKNIDPFDEIKINTPTQDKLLEEKESYQTMLESLKDDDDGILVFEELATGLKAREIAEFLGIDIKKVNNIIKRVRRNTLNTLSKKHGKL